ncbi:uncharacterized protein G2W53_021830 [Senna tora]|uniref:Uncharacterized protein n=1 Tax=Senna tora TaxID=362788 RepID=A0A834WLH0_9FABA|nr:uncharacterized protein G2W53_021830 [Senna tora]
MGGARMMSQHIPDDKSGSDLRNLHELRGKKFVAQVSQTRRFALYLRIGVVLMLQLESSWHGRSVDHGFTYSGQQIAVGSEKPSRITRQRSCCASESNTSVRVVFANRSGFDAPTGVVLAWEERGSSLNIFQMTNRGRIPENFTNYEAKYLLRNGFEVPIGVVLAWEERGSCLNIIRMTNHGRIPENFTNYEAKDLLRKSVDHVLTYFGRQIAVGPQKPSRTTRLKTCCASESNTSVRVVFANQSGFDAPIGVVLAWEERGSCLNIFQMTNHGRTSETFTNYEAKDLLRNRLGMGGAWIMSQHIPDDKSRLDLRNLHELGGKRLAVHSSWHERNMDHFLKYSRRQIASSCHGRSVDHVLKYFGRQIVVGSQKPSRISRQKTCCASVVNTSVRVVFANRSGFDAPIAVFLAWEERGSCLNIFRTTNRGRISETFSNYDAKVLLRKRVKHVVVLAWEERGSCLNIFQMTSQSDLRNLHELRGKTLVAGSNTSVRVVFANRCGFDAPIGVVLAWEERGSCLNIFWTKNRGRISETFMNYEAKELLRNRISETFTNYEANNLLRKSVDHVLTYSERQIVVGSQKPSRITRQKTCCASELNTSVRVVFATRSGFDAPIAVVLAWEERGSCLNIFRMTNRDRISETFTNYEAKDLLCNCLGMGGAWIMYYHIPDDKSRSDLRNLHELHGKRLVAEVGQTRRCALYLRTGAKPSRITRQKTYCASESNTSVRVVFSSRSGFDAPIGVVLAWEERGSCLNIFRTTNRVMKSMTWRALKDGRLTL